MKTILMFVACSFAYSAAVAQNDAANCFRAIQNKPEVMPLVGKVAMYGELSDFRFLTNSSKVASDEERAAIGTYVEARRQCEVMMPAGHPDIVAARKTQVSNLEAAAAELYVGSITYGDFTKIRIRLDNEMRSFIQSWESARRAEAEQQEVARRQAILGILANRPSYQPAPLTFTPMQIPKTTSTNCNWLGSTLNCTSR